MDKPLLLQWLSTVREQAEVAHLETVTQSQRVTELEQERRETARAKVGLHQAKMTEQKLLLQLAWILDQLDKIEF